MGHVIWLASYPKSGNTWTRAFLSAYAREGTLDLGQLGSGMALASKHRLGRLLGADPDLFHPDELLELRPAAARRLARDHRDAAEPSFHKVHGANVRTAAGELLFPADAGRALYIVRNPLDVVASWAPFFGVSLDRTIDALAYEPFVLGGAAGRFAPTVPESLLSWSGHVRSWLDAPGVATHVLRYEDLQADPEAAFAGALRFAGLDPDPARVAAAVEAARFDRLQRREAEEGFDEVPPRFDGAFFRRGRAGGWRDELSPAQARRVVADHRDVMARLGYGDLVHEVEALPAEPERAETRASS